MENAYRNEHIDYRGHNKMTTERIPATAPFKWLREGAKNLASAPLIGIGYGITFAVLSLAASYIGFTRPQLALTFFTALILVGPFLATGLYKTVRRENEVKTNTPAPTLLPSKSQASQLAVYTGIMLLLAIAWIRMTTIAVALYLSQASAGEEILISMISTSDGLYFLGLLSISIFLFTNIVFALSAIGLPMIIDGKATAVPAMIASVKTVLSQPAAMLVWASLIAALTVIGIATFFVGLIFIFPLLGYATWHSYKALVK